MDTASTGTSFCSNIGQFAWVVKDIQASEKFFRDNLGIKNFVKLENLRSEDLEGTYKGKPGNFVFHLYLAYSNESLIELIQPVSGESMYQDYLDKHPEGGVQHIAYLLPVADFDKAVSELTNKGFSIITSLNLPVVKVSYFDTYKEIGIVTEIIGVKETGVEFLQQMKDGSI
jgi:methylmalonyl-CoA/ethylmalonyl-CoA epimerase